MNLNERPARHRPTPLKVVFLSGLSDPSTCALHPLQTRFLASLPAPEEWKVYRNFPWVDCPQEQLSLPPLWLASMRNFQQFLMARRRIYRETARRHWDALAASTDAIAVITLSCGLEILNNCLGRYGSGPAVRVFAIGPVAWEPPRVPALLVQGSRDFLSRAFFRKADLVFPGLGHMDYLKDARVLEQGNRWLCSSTST